MCGQFSEHFHHHTRTDVITECSNLLDFVSSRLVVYMKVCLHLEFVFFEVSFLVLLPVPFEVDSMKIAKREGKKLRRTRVLAVKGSQAPFFVRY